jgi:hypothetical protein
MLDLHGECAHTLVVGARNVQRLRREVVFAFRHGFGDVHNLLFDAANIVV